MEDIKDYEIDCDLRQCDEYGEYMKSINWQVIEIQNSKFKVQNTKKIITFIKMLGPVGICKIQRYKGEIDFSELKKILQEYHVIRCILEPEIISTTPKSPPNLGGDFSYKINKEPLLGTKTLRINLRQSERDLFNSFNKDCRYILRKFRIVLQQIHKFTNNDFESFYEILKASGKRLDIWTTTKKDYDNLVKCFGKNCFCITIDNKAGCLVLIVNNTAFYYYAGATREGTTENLPYLVVWEAMKEAKKRGCKVWDFEGIYDARWPDKRWLGFSHFKKSFGGKEIEFPGSFAKWRWPF